MANILIEMINLKDGLSIAFSQSLRHSLQMQTPLNASAVTAGNLISNQLFEIPQYQREYSWLSDDVNLFWQDISQSLDQETYFLGLIILTGDEAGERKVIVDGQQRLITLTLLTTAMFYAAQRVGRSALADKIKADFIYAIDYETGDSLRRIILTDPTDDETLKAILIDGKAPTSFSSDESISTVIARSYNLLEKLLQRYLADDPFKKLGKLTRFLSESLYFAVFLHPSAGEAYSVFEVINTRGKGLTTADLLKNYILSQTPASEKDSVYARWQSLSKKFASDGKSNNFVQYIRHVVTMHKGHILPRDLFNFLSGRKQYQSKSPPSYMELIDWLETNIDRYMQMVDTSNLGPATAAELQVYDALSTLQVIALRPILLAITDLRDPTEYARNVLRIVVQRMVTGQLGTGSVEVRFGETAHAIFVNKDSSLLNKMLGELIPDKDSFIDRLHRRSLSKKVMSFVSNSILENTIVPEAQRHLHYIWIDGSNEWTEDEGIIWGKTLGNAFLSNQRKRPMPSITWHEFSQNMLSTGADNAANEYLSSLTEWSPEIASDIGLQLAKKGGDIWYRD